MQQIVSFENGHKLSDWVRTNRAVELVSTQGAEVFEDLTVFVGLYNAEPFWPDIVGYLDAQTNKNCHLLLVDNASTDSTWELIQTWAPGGFASVQRVRNPANLGGAGSLFANLDLVKSKWVTTCHQDDFYYSNHLKVHHEMTSQVHEKVAMVTTSMDRVKHDGYSPIPFPRANWISSQETSADVLLTHLRFHSLPFPAATFRADALREIEIPWHDTSFPDTEIIMLLAGEWEFQTSPVCTMAYRENPASESHVISSAHREKGQIRALLRIFNSNSFRAIARTVNPSDWESFFEHASESIEMRISDKKLSQEAIFVLAESLSIAWNYGSAKANSVISERLKSDGNRFGELFLEFRVINPETSPGSIEALPVRAPKFNQKRSSGLILRMSRSLIRLVFVSASRTGLLSFRKDFQFRWRKKR